jgi:hypothetical protein
MNRLRRRLIDPDRADEGPRVAEYAVILFVIAALAFGALLLTSAQTTVILSTVSGSV